MDRMCPNCKPDRKLTRNGKGRYRCRSCGYSKTDSERIQGSLPKYGDKPQTGYERLKRHRAKKKREKDLEG